MMYDVIFSGGSLIFALQDVEIAGFAIMDILLFATAVSLPFVITLIVYSAFYILEFICHEQRGFHALAASTHIVYGRFWPIALRLGVMMAIIIAVNYVLTIMFGLSQKYATTATVIGEVVAMVVSFFFVVMFMRYLALLHTAAVASTTPYLREPLSQSYKTYKFITIVGAGVMVLFVLGSLLALLGFAA
jgi:hypothetical protein